MVQSQFHIQKTLDFKRDNIGITIVSFHKKSQKIHIKLFYRATQMEQKLNYLNQLAELLLLAASVRRKPFITLGMSVTDSVMVPV